MKECFALNQGATCHPLFFDPLNKVVDIRITDGDAVFQYNEEEPATTICENGDVKFAMYAPEASTVEVAGITGTFPSEKISLSKDKDGYFRTVIQGIKPGFHYFHWYVDGVPVRNMKGCFTYGCFDHTNFIDVPKSQEEFYLLKEVPHGDVSTHLYRSSVNGHMKLCYVYTPPKYKEDRNKRYPVLYLLHGVGESESSWLWHGKANFVLDNLISEGKCVEMIVVMCCGYAFEDEKQAIFYPGDFDRELVEDCIKEIDHKYRTIAKQQARAVAGASLGSAQASLSFAKHPELFAALGVFSGGKIEELDTALQQENTMYQYIFFGCGEGEKELVSRLPKYKEDVTVHGIQCDIANYEGIHEWHPWRNALRDFVSHLFTWDYNIGEVTEVRIKKFTEQSYWSQTCEEQINFFDPMYKGVIFAVDEKGNPAGRYVDEPHGMELNEDGSVTANMYAPNAKTVVIDIAGEQVELHQVENKPEWWSCTMNHTHPGFHYFTYLVNGTRTINPKSPLGYGGFCAWNYFEYPEKEHTEYVLKDIPHGSVHMNYIKSSVTGRMKLCYVYTPYGYEKEDTTYPVLYLQHGGGENEIGWVWQGKIANILDDCIYHGTCEKMIVVMSTGYSFRPDGTSNQATGELEVELREDIIPYIDRQYRTKKDRRCRAVAGLSMGGFQAQKAAWSSPDLFASIGIFSANIFEKDTTSDYTELFSNAKRFNELFNVCFLACGTKDFIYEKVIETYQEATRKGLKFDLFEEDGYHDWTFWRHCVVVFLKKLFR